MPSHMASGLHLQPRHRRVIEGLAQRHLPGVDVWAYGSRVNGHSHEGSDLDLVLRGPKLEKIPSPQLGAFCDALQESTLPFLVEARDWARLPDRFHAQIQRDYVALASETGGWRNATLGDCAILVRDSVMPSACPDLPYIGLEHIGQGTLSLNDVGSAREVDSTKTAFSAGDILFGKLRPYFRKVVRPDFDGICSTDIWVIRPGGDVDAGFLFYLLASPEFVDFASQGAEGTRMPRAKWEQASRLSLRLPPASDQRAIAQVLGALDEKIELNRRVATTLEGTIRALFQSLFVAAESPWPVQRLGDVSSTTRGRSYRSSELVERSKTAMVTLKSFRRGGGYKPDGLKPFRGPYDGEQIVRSGDVVVACTDVTQDAAVVGRSAVVQESRRFDTLVASLDVLILRPTADCVSTAFLHGLTNTHDFLSHAKSHATGTTVLHMASGAVPSFKFPCPPREQMASFDRLAEPAMARCGSIFQETDRLTDLRDTLLPKLISGEIRIPDAEEIVEAAT